MEAKNGSYGAMPAAWIGLAVLMAGAAVLTVRRLARERGSRREFVLPKGAGLPALSLQRCPFHGIAYDAEKEVCPACAAGRRPGP